MKLEKISVEFSQKINLPDYQGAEAKVWICAEAEDGDNIEEISTELFAKAKDAVYSQLTEIAKSHGKEIPSIKNFFVGKEVEQPQPKYPSAIHGLKPVSRTPKNGLLRPSPDDDIIAVQYLEDDLIEEYDDVPF